VDGVHTPRSDERLVELAEDHREHVPERALEAPYDIRARGRMVIEGVRDHRMSELQERSAPAAKEHGEIPTELPRNRSRPQDPLPWVRNLTRQ
jgi:hypothetical protein